MSRNFLLLLARYFFLLFTLSASLGILSFLHEAWQGNAYTLSRPLILLVVGVDQDVGGADNRRADVIALLFADISSGTLRLLSIPRDTYTRIKGNGFGRLNATYGRGGIPLLKTTLEILLERKVDKYLVLNFEAFRKAVDLVGGVEIYVDKDMKYEDTAQNLSCSLPAGRYVLHGEQALCYVRYRLDPMGDIDRIHRQQKLIRALAMKVRSHHSFYQLSRWYMELRKEIKTDADLREIFWLYRTLSRMKEGGLKADLLPGKPVKPYWKPDVLESRKLMSQLSRLG